MVVSSCFMWPETILHHSPIWEVSVHLTSTLHLASISPLPVLIVLSVSQYHLCLFQCHIFSVCVSLSLSAHLVPPSLPLHPSACLPSLYIRCFVFVLTFRFIQFRQLSLSYVYYFRVIYIKGLNLLFVCNSKKVDVYVVDVLFTVQRTRRRQFLTWTLPPATSCSLFLPQTSNMTP